MIDRPSASIIPLSSELTNCSWSWGTLNLKTLLEWQELNRDLKENGDSTRENMNSKTNSVGFLREQ